MYKKTIPVGFTEAFWFDNEYAFDYKYDFFAFELIMFTMRSSAIFVAQGVPMLSASTAVFFGERRLFTFWELLKISHSIQTLRALLKCVRKHICKVQHFAITSKILGAIHSLL